MIVVKRGDRIVPTVIFRDPENPDSVVDAGATTITIKNPAGLAVLDTASADNVSIGHYKYSWLVPVNSVVGFYTITWTPATGDSFSDSFEVVILTPAEEKRLLDQVRIKIADRIPRGGSDVDCRYSDDEIIETYTDEGTVNRTILAMLRSTAAEYAELIDIDESGSIRKMSQKFKAVAELISRYEAMVALELTARTASNTPVGKSIPWARSIEWEIVASQYDIYLRNPLV